MNRVEKFRNCIMGASGQVRRRIVAENLDVYRAPKIKCDYILGWFKHPDSSMKVYEVKYNPSIGVTCADFDRGNNGTAHDIARRIPENYEWEENPSLLENFTL